MTSKADNFSPCTEDTSSALLQERMDLSLQKLKEEADGCNLFPPRAFFT